MSNLSKPNLKKNNCYFSIIISIVTLSQFLKFIFYMAFVFYLVFQCFISFLECLIIKEVGLAPLHKGDIGMIFYVTVENIGPEPEHVVVRGLQCCQAVQEDDRDCKSMKLIGGDMGQLKPGASSNLTLIYPNLYLHNRVGSCDIGIFFREENKLTRKLEAKISFNTTLVGYNVSSIMTDYYNPSDFRDCATVDQDPLDGCLPYNCHMRYSGHRNYFNYRSQRCEGVPNCMADLDRELPDVAYVPTSNTCRDLDKPITSDDIEQMLRASSDPASNDDNPFKNIRCHHGHLNNRTGICICDRGWTSAPWDHDALGPSTSIIHMCTIQLRTWSDTDRMKSRIAAISIIAIFLALMFLLCTFALNTLWRYSEKDLDKRPSMHSMSAGTGTGSGSKIGIGAASEPGEKSSESVEQLMVESTLSSEEAAGQSDNTSSARNTD